MDEMQLLREFAGPSELPERDDLAQARAKLVTATISTAATAPAHPHRKRVLWGGLTAVGLAAAITAALALAPVDNAVLLGPVPRAGAAEAVRVLNAAAAAALKMPDTPPRPDQFVYIKSQGPNSYLYEGWFSADGTHDGLTKPSVPRGEPAELVAAGCRDGKRVITNSNGGRSNGKLEKCVPEPAYDPDLPTNASGMLATIASRYSEEGGVSNVNGIAKDAMTLLSMRYLRPDQRSALFGALAEVPGITFTENVKDAAGRTGVGISWTAPGGATSAFIFDPGTYAYLGTETEAQMAYAIVDKVREVP
jgi:hypothetical protein